MQEHSPGAPVCAWKNRRTDWPVLRTRLRQIMIMEVSLTYPEMVIIWQACAEILVVTLQVGLARNEGYACVRQGDRRD